MNHAVKFVATVLAIGGAIGLAQAQSAGANSGSTSTNDSAAPPVTGNVASGAHAGKMSKHGLASRAKPASGTSSMPADGSMSNKRVGTGG